VASRLVMVFVVVSLNFVLFRALPGNATNTIGAVPNASPALQHALTTEFGLDRPLWDQYVAYLGQLVHGNLGVSYDNEQPVAANLITDLANTLPMVALGTTLAIVLGIVTGVLSAWRRGTLTDGVVTATALALFSSPAQWLGLLLVMAFGGLLPVSGMSDPFLLNPTPWEHVRDLLTHMVLPSLTLALSLYGGYALVVQSSVLETLGQDHILLARAKGLPAAMILRRHALRNALLPTTTWIALALGHLVAGAILVETVFSWPGIGRAIYRAILDRDYPMLQGAFLVITLAVVVSNLLIDLLYTRLDPRAATA
jgi:ABC-type dipeptide/oligopeptide/nickel transport system permease component